MVLLNFPELRQTFPYDCGAAAALAVLAYYGTDVDEVDVMRRAKTNKQGTHPDNLIKALKSYGLKVTAEKMTIRMVKSYIRRHIPVILLLQAYTSDPKIDWKNDWDDGHYAVAIGYHGDRIIFDDPKSVLRTYLTSDDLKTRWHDISAQKKKYVNFGIAVYGKEPTFSLRKVRHMP